MLLGNKLLFEYCVRREHASARGFMHSLWNTLCAEYKGFLMVKYFSLFLEILILALLKKTDEYFI